MKKKLTPFFALVFLLVATLQFTSCKSCKKSEPVNEVKTDSVPAQSTIPANMLNVPHADTSLIPILSAVLDDAFAASAKRDYTHLASLIIYRGPDVKKMGYGVFDARNPYDKTVVRITADVFTKWNKDVTTPEYGRVFALDQPDGRTLPVLEVIFPSPKQFERKFFGFLQVGDEWKIADVTLNL